MEMTGHIRRRGERSWELKFDAGNDPLTGKRRIRYFSFKGTKRDAEIKLARLVSANADGEGIDPSRATLTEFLDRWDRDWASTNVSPKTLERYRQILKLYVKPHLGLSRIQKLRAIHLIELYAALLRSGGHKDRPLSARTVGHVHRVLHRALGHAAAWGVVAQNVVGLVGPPPVPSTEIKILTEQQIGGLLRHLEGRTLRPIVALALATGARRNELLALRLKDVDLDAGLVRIERSLEQTKGSLRFKSPKTKNGRRSIAIPPLTVAELRAHLLKQQKRRLALGMGRASDDDLLFARWDGVVRSPHWLTQKFAQAMASLKLDCTLHGLRHTHASQLIAAGMDVLTISRRLGHGNPTITLSVYGHLFSNTDARAAEIMQASFAKMQETDGEQIVELQR
jgi:integrase